MTDEFSNYSPELTKSAATAAKCAVEQNTAILTCPAQCTTLSLRDFLCQTLNPPISGRCNDFSEQLGVKGS